MQNWNGDIEVYYCQCCGEEIDKYQFLADGLCRFCGRQEDQYWAESAQAVIDEANAMGEKPIPWDEVKKDLGL